MKIYCKCSDRGGGGATTREERSRVTSHLMRGWLHVAQMAVLEKSILTSSGGTACALLLFFILRNVGPDFGSPPPIVSALNAAPGSHRPASPLCLQEEAEGVKAGGIRSPKVGLQLAARSTSTGPARHALSPWRGHAVTVCAAVYLVWHDMTFNKKYRHYQDSLTASAVTGSKKLAWKRPRPRTKKNKKHFSVSDFKPLFTVRIDMWLGKFVINAKTSFNTFIFSLSVKVISFISIYSIYVSI